MPYVTRDGGSVVNGWSKFNTTGGGQEFLDLPDSEITTFNAIGDTLPVAKPINTTAATALIDATVATQAEQETGTDLTKLVAPGNQHFHRSAVKAWVRFDGTGTPSINDSYNVTSLTDLGTGHYRVNLSITLSSVDSCVLATGDDTNSANQHTYNVQDITATSFEISVRAVDNNVRTDSAFISAAVLGDI